MTDDVSVVPSICVFDVNETLLDIEFIAPLFQRLFGDRKALREWFGELILYSEAITLSGAYATFFNLGQGVLKMLGSIHGVSITETDVDELKTRMLTMPAHADVAAGLKRRTRSTLNDLSNHPSMPACFSGLVCGSGGELVHVTKRNPAPFNCFNPAGTSACAGIVSIRVLSSSTSVSVIETPWIEPNIFNTPCPNVKNVV